MRASLFYVLLAGCSSQPGEPPAEPVNPCEHTAIAASSATADQASSIDAAIGMWSTRGVTGLARGDGARLTIVFRAASDSFYGFYEDTSATVYVNEAIVDSSARAVVIAHELGHALGLVHISSETRASVMNPGNLTIAPNADDAAALAALWGFCAP